MDTNTKEDLLYIYSQLYKSYREVSSESLFMLDVEKQEFIYAPGDRKDFISRRQVKGILDGIEEWCDSGERQDRVIFKTFMMEIYETRTEAVFEFQCHTEGAQAGHWYRIEGKPLLDREGNVRSIHGRAMDVDELVRDRKKLEILAQQDDLTGLYNLTVMTGKIDAYLNAGTEFSVILLDIDDFEEINEKQGRLFGDYIQDQAGRLLRSCVPDSADVGRILDGRFMVLYDNVEEGRIQAVIDSVHSACEELSGKRDAVESLSFSTGIARHPWCGNTRDILLCRAEAALEHAKLTGKNSYIYYLEVGKSEAEASANAREIQTGNIHRSSRELFQVVQETIVQASNTDKALQASMEIIAARLELDKVSIMEFDVPGESVYCLYQWAVRGLFSEKKEYLSYGKNIIHQFLEEADRAQGKFIVDDIEAKDLNNIYFYSLKHKGVKSAVHYFTFVNGLTRYDFQFETYHKKHTWTEAEKDVLYKISKLLSDVMVNQKPGTKMEEFFDRFVNYDRLTTLFTFQRFIQEAQVLRMSYATRHFVVTYTDFRNFKYINDALGYSAGDSILYEFARMLKEKYGKGTSCAGRVTNDCFVTVGVYDNEEDGRTDIDEIKERFIQKLKQKYPSINLIMDTGIYLLKAEDEIAGAMDNANYARKTIKTGSLKGGTLIFDDKLHAQFAWQAQVLNSLDSSLDKEEFKVYYQPKVSLGTRTVEGAEALIRWRRENGEIAYPDQFIPFCEQHDVIGKLDFYVLHKTCEMLHDWMEAGKELICVSVNLSRNDCIRPGFADILTEEVDRWNIPHKYIEFEVTESAFAQSLSTMYGFLHQLLEAGFEISMDDFGSGYSSLNILPDMPVSIIKLDKEFWRQESSKKRKILLVKAVELLKTMGFQIICEGIELPEQADFCQQIGCGMAQGYLFSRPVPRDAFEELLWKSNRVI